MSFPYFAICLEKNHHNNYIAKIRVYKSEVKYKECILGPNIPTVKDVERLAVKWLNSNYSNWRAKS